jgi:hypothetical protein
MTEHASQIVLWTRVPQTELGDLRAGEHEGHWLVAADASRPDAAEPASWLQTWMDVDSIPEVVKTETDGPRDPGIHNVYGHPLGDAHDDAVMLAVTVPRFG